MKTHGFSGAFRLSILIGAEPRQQQSIALAAANTKSETPPQ
jgi:hypothetical protein